MPVQKPCDNIVAIDLFCGAGGLTFGLREGGIQVAAGIDADCASRHAFETNNPRSKFILKRVEELTKADLDTLWSGATERLLAGCAPCQPFSTYSQGRDSEDDERWGLLNEFSRLVKLTLPEYVTMENVPTLAATSVFRSFVGVLRRNKYRVWKGVVDCVDFGLAQRRERLVLLASRTPRRRPTLSHSSAAPLSVRHVLKDVPPIAAGDQHSADSVHRSAKLSPLNLQRIRKSTPGGTWRDWPESLRAACHRKESGDGYLAVYGRMSWDAAAPTLTTQCYNYGSGRFGHPEQDRPISLREAAILQGFPPNYLFEDKDSPLPTRDLARLIGNAVPPPLGRSIAQSFAPCRQQP